MSEKISRRELIQKSLLGFGALSIPVAFTGCNDGSDDESPEIQADFLHGVASGDPLQDKVILWLCTRQISQNPYPIRIL
ncbi:TPA: hypothetical protein OXO22_002942, partial [Acinetobacter baumannii]|nr:hypothetical protein [Acinetobacter baumannii]HCT4552235.1 hypothetical protein [Acinetobacter baumannii]HCT4561142.1 hypothetical protein [Acinetobacter baumannii]HCU1842273.1 hypothetical protein [Acinetobacter baumannii]HCU1858950.1 hypothetical protein [Acinetobacter baumannii]